MAQKFSRFYQLTAAFLVFLLYFIFLSHKINLATADLGRHIRNGEVILSTHQIIKTNFYSYTESDFPVINHHWGAGVVFYLIYKSWGFWGISGFFVTVSLVTFLIFFKLAIKVSNLGIATVVSLMILPLLAERTEIRPEIFTYFFAGLVFWFLSNKKFVWLIPFVEILWVNVHIYFFIAPVLVFIFWLKERSRRLLVVLGLAIVASFVNPYGWRAVIEPFLILKNYGYQIIENQPLWFIERFVYNPNFLIFKVVFSLSIFIFIAASLRRRKVDLVDLLILVGLSLAAWLQIRNFTIFGYFSLVVVGRSIAYLFKGTHVDQYKYSISLFLAAMVSLITFMAIERGVFANFPYWHYFGWGLEEDVTKSAEFFRENNLKGPIFNDYDIGSYLIFNLYPAERVFVDNRPEAYSVDFFKKTYVPMQEDEAKWAEADGRYHFNAIYFSPRDATPWAQRFLKVRLADPDWVPVYFDVYALILVRNAPVNQALINRFSLPKDRFVWP